MVLNFQRLLVNGVGTVFILAAVAGVARAYLSIRSTPVRQVAPMKCAVHEDGATDSAAPCMIWQPSLLQLLARPEFFHGRLVEVVGYVHFDFEVSGIHVHRADSAQRRDDHGLWLEPGFDQRHCQDSYARVRGRFNAHSGGHMDLNAGSIEAVSLCKALRPAQLQ